MHNSIDVIPEYVADIPGKKAEKVDYAIFKGEVPIILIECKVVRSELSREKSDQLFRYFTSTSARFGILTDGLQYRFYSDLDEQNKMDKSPFMEINLAEDTPETIARNLVVFTKSKFGRELAIAFAKKTKYKEAIKRLLSEQMREPSRDFVSFVLNKVVYREIYKGSKTRAVREDFVKIIGEVSRDLIRAPDPPPNGDYHPKQWTSLADFDLNSYKSKNGKPYQLCIRFWNGEKVKLKHYNDLLKRTGELLYQEGSLTMDQLPYSLSDQSNRYFLNTKPIHKSGNEFNAKYQLPGIQIYMDTCFSSNDVIRYCRKFLKDFGKDPHKDVCLKAKPPNSTDASDVL